MLASCDAGLLIGDPALFVDHRALAAEKIDMGQAWTDLTGLPFVWAFWAGRPGALTAAEVAALQEARNAGVDESEAIARDYFPGLPDRARVGAKYLRDNIRHHLGPDERAGLELFYRYAAEAGAVNSPAPLDFFGQ